MVVEADVDGIERDDQVWSVEDLLKSVDDSRRTTHFPDKILVRRAIVHHHSLFIDERKLRALDGTRIIAMEAEITE